MQRFNEAKIPHTTNLTDRLRSKGSKESKLSGDLEHLYDYTTPIGTAELINEDPLEKTRS